MKYIQINPLDNVAVALTDLKAGERVGDVVLRTDLSRGHKVLLKDLKEGEDVIKYGSPIGHVTRDIPAVWLVREDGSAVCIRDTFETSLLNTPDKERMADHGQTY